MNTRSRILLVAFLCGLAAFTMAQVRRISQEPVTTTIAGGDDLIVNKNLGASYTTRRIAFSNLVAGLSISAQSNVYYMDVKGNDVTGSGSLTAPLATLSNALARCVPQSNSVVYIQPGTYLLAGTWNGITNGGCARIYYQSNITIWPLGFADFYSPTGVTLLSIKGAGNINIKPGLGLRYAKTAATVNAISNMVVAQPGYVFGAIHINDSDYVTIDGTQVNDAPGWGVFCNNESFVAATSTNITVKNSTFTRCGIYASSAVLDDSILTESTNWFGGGVAIGGGNVMENCLMTECQVGIGLRNFNGTTRNPPVTILRCRVINPNYRGLQSRYYNFEGLLLKDSYFYRTTNGMEIGGTPLSIPFMAPWQYPKLVEIGMNNARLIDSTFLGGTWAFEMSGSAMTNLLVENCTFNDTWKYCLEFAQPNGISYAARIRKNTFNNLGEYAIIASGFLFEPRIEGNFVNLFDLKNQNQAAIGFKLAPIVSNLVVRGNTTIGPPWVSFDAIDLGMTNVQVGCIVGDNPTYRVGESLKFTGLTNANPLFLDLPMMVQTNGEQSVAVVFPDPITNSVKWTNYLASINAVRKAAPFPTWGGTNVQWRLVKNLTLTNVLDVSACAWYPSNRTFFTIHNNGNGTITEWTLDGVCTRILTNPVAGTVPDCESITWMGGNRFAVVDEDNNRIFILSITNGATGWVTNNATIVQLSSSIGVDGGTPSGVEGIAWDADRNGWWVVREKGPAQLLFCSADGSVTNNWFSTAQMQTFTNANHTDFSDIFLDRQNQMLWVTQDEPNQYDRVLGISLLTSNVVVTLDCTNFGQLEGVSMTLDNKLLLAGEVNQFAIYEPYIGGLNTGMGWTQPATNSPSVPYYPNGVAVGTYPTNFLLGAYIITNALDPASLGAYQSANYSVTFALAARGDVVDLGLDPVLTATNHNCIAVRACATNGAVILSYQNTTNVAIDVPNHTNKILLWKF